MSKNVTITPDQFSKAVERALIEFEDHAMDVIESSATSAARQTASDLKKSAPSGGQYARGWTHKKQGNGRTSFTDTVHNRIYQLTHLLEKPHTTGGGGHYPKNVDYTGTIARAEDANAQKYIQEVMSKL